MRVSDTQRKNQPLTHLVTVTECGPWGVFCACVCIPFTLYARICAAICSGIILHVLIIINVYDSCQPPALVNSGYCPHICPCLPQQANTVIMTLTHFLTLCNVLNAHRLKQEKENDDNDDNNGGFPVLWYVWMIMATKITIFKFIMLKGKKRVFHRVQRLFMLTRALR